MVREDEIDSAHVDIDLITEKVSITCATLNMPSWTSFDNFFLTVECDRYCPLVLPIILRIICLPESKVCNLFLVIFIIFHANTRYHPLEVEVGEFSIVLEFADTIIDTSIVSEVRISLLDESINEFSHIIDQFSYGHDIVCWDYPELSTVFEKCLCIEVRQFFYGFSLILAIADDLILDISDIHRCLYLVSEESHASHDEIIHQIVTEISDMGIVIRCWSTIVDLDSILFEWLERFERASECIIEM